ncbi:Non-lysosomal glucosylceramidase [Pelomyxa schiedti]|nr:Non-lysosomal glucosylceramidase [Pelomyxa schiedti]
MWPTSRVEILALVVVITGLLCGNVVCITHRMSLVVNEDATYKILVDSVTWLQSGPTAIHAGGVWASTSAATLQLITVENATTESDVFGSYTIIKHTYQSILDPNVLMVLSFKSYTDYEMVVLDQEFPNGASDTSLNDNTDIVSAFPSFYVKNTVNFLTYYGEFAVPLLGQWDVTKFVGGVSGGVPLCLYDQNMATLVISPMKNFMIGSQIISSTLEEALACGIQGKVQSLPSGFVHSTVIVFDVGVTQAMYDWGSHLLTLSSKYRSSSTDLTAQQLHYNTDNGAYYYFQTEPSKTYQDTMIDLYNEQSQYCSKVYQFDRWWYTTTGTAVKLWEPRADVFPNGFRYVANNMGNSSFILQTSCFSSDNAYAKNFSFTIESTCSLPNNQDLYDYLFTKATSWGAVVYKVDDLATTYLQMEATQQTVTFASNWLKNMGNAASQKYLSIQYSRPLPNHLLASTEILAVTAARTSVDYQPSNEQWKVFFNNLLVWCLGLVPVKDTFWTSETESDCPYTKCREPNSVLHALVSALSCGPIASGDKIGMTDSDLISKTCMKDGTLIKPDRPAIPLNTVFSQFNEPEIIQLASTSSESSNMVWNYVIAAQLTETVSVYPSSLALAGTQCIAVDYFDAPDTPIVFNDTRPLIIEQMANDDEVTDFKYYVIAPVLQSGWFLIGDTSKFLTVAHPRIKQITTNSTAVTVRIHGNPLESCSIKALPPGSSTFVTGSCLIPSTLSDCSIVCFCNPACNCTSI